MSRLMFKIFAFVVIAILAIVAGAKNGTLKGCGNWLSSSTDRSAYAVDRDLARGK